ncbi:MAG: BREX system Lon protease-like protein BrxL [Chloroflexi bacterium]|nr:BREX system Lon protease-like protein BrxL [Chloroflexota bacterium]
MSETAIPTEPNTLSALDQKVHQNLGDRVVLKRLTRWNEAYKEFPRYVMEYLCNRYVNPDEPKTGQDKIDHLLSEHYVESSQKELIKSKIKENGAYTLLGELRVRLDEKRDHYWAEVPALGSGNVRVSALVLKDHGDVLLSSGAWGSMVVEYDASYELKGSKYPLYLREFRPFQVTRLSLDDFMNKRALFTDAEWMDLLIQSIGFAPAKFSSREKWLYLLRLVPFVEANYNMVELGPRETGKTYTFRNTSSRSFVVSGGTATPAVLFYNQASRKIGILGLKDVVYFDEIGSTRFSDPEATISVLKDYMQTGQFSRGANQFMAQASIVMGGNLEVDMTSRRPADYYLHLFIPLPIELRSDTAFLDRLHSYLPGWELPKIQPDNYARGYGFITDYLAAIFVQFRRRNFQTLLSGRVDFGNATGRNQDAVRKTTAGLLKLMYPHRDSATLLASELKECLDMAVECRQRVIDQLAVIAPREFGDVRLDQSIRITG